MLNQEYKYKYIKTAKVADTFLDYLKETNSRESFTSRFCDKKMPVIIPTLGENQISHALLSAFSYLSSGEKDVLILVLNEKNDLKEINVMRISNSESDFNVKIDDSVLNQSASEFEKNSELTIRTIEIEHLSNRDFNF